MEKDQKTFGENNNKQTIICGFAGIGKSYFSRKSGCHDSDSSLFSWSGKERHPDWPLNYIEHIKGLEGLVLCSAHKEVRDCLFDNGLPFFLCYPLQSCKQEYLLRYYERGSDEKFINLFDQKWNTFIKDMQNENRAEKHIVLNSGEYLGDLKLPN